MAWWLHYEMAKRLQSQLKSGSQPRFGRASNVARFLLHLSGRMEVTAGLAETDQVGAGLHPGSDAILARFEQGGGHTGGMTAGIVVTSLVVWPAAPFFLFMHGKDSVIPKGTEITAYVNGEIKLERTKFQSGAPYAQTQGYEKKPTGAAPQSMPPLKALVPVIPASEIHYENSFASSSPRRQQPASDNRLVSVTFASIPAGAFVFLQEALVGRAPTAVMLQPGPYEVKMSADGYADWVGTLTVEAGKPFSLAAQLHPR
jgi:hypothetical protein